MKFKTLFLFGSVMGFFVWSASAQGLAPSAISSIANAYRDYKEIDNLTVGVPTVVKVSFGEEFIERLNFAILDKTADTFEPYFLEQETLINRIPLTVSAYPNINGASFMLDNNAQTYAEFPLPENAPGLAQINLMSINPVTSSTLSVLLDNHVALPSFVEIRAWVDGQNKIVVAKRAIGETTISFPQTTSDRWTINFTFVQPLRISELRLQQENAVKTSSLAIRFLAQPLRSYRVYFNPDRQVTPPVGEAGNLAAAEDVMAITYAPSRRNPNYIMADVDNDGVPDIRDNCVTIANANQDDVNRNGRGDACDDFDQDSVINAKDNCPNTPNRDQRDTDGDGLGDVCDKEESRVTERYPLIPWIGIGFAALVLIILFALTARSVPPAPEQNSQ